MSAARWLLLVLVLGLGCEGRGCSRPWPDRQVSLDETDWQQYTLENLRNREFDASDWEPLFKVVREEPLDGASLEHAVSLLFQFADAPRQERLFALLDRRAHVGNRDFLRVAAWHHLMAAQRARKADAGAASELYAREVEQALEWARKGAEAGDRFCMRLVGEIILVDPVRFQDQRSEARALVQRAAELGDEEASQLLPQMLP